MKLLKLLKQFSLGALLAAFAISFAGCESSKATAPEAAVSTNPRAPVAPTAPKAPSAPATPATPSVSAVPATPATPAGSTNPAPQTPPVRIKAGHFSSFKDSEG